MIPKKGSRSLDISGNRYRWLLRVKPTKRHTEGHPFVVAVAAEDGKGTLLVEVGPHASNGVSLLGTSVKPGDVRRWVDEALANGWDPRAPGKHRMIGRGAARVFPRGTQVLDRSQVWDWASSSATNVLSTPSGGPSGGILIDDVAFLERVRIAETEHVSREIAQRITRGEPPEALLGLVPGGYRPPAVLVKLDRYLHVVVDDNTWVMLDCACGSPGCWPLTASIFVVADRVVWCDFRQVHRDWILDLGPFVFAMDNYVKVMGPPVQDQPGNSR